MITRALIPTFLVLITACDPGTAQQPSTNEPAAGSGRSSGVVLQYHHVADDTPEVTSIDPEQFRKHLDRLEAGGYAVWPLDRLVDALRRGNAVPDKVVTITFDDAYLDIYENGFPLLHKRNWPFTIFVTTKLVGTRGGYLNWRQLNEMREAGALIANHTHSHAHLLRRQEGESENDWKSRIRGEIVTAEKVIEEHLGTGTDLFAYPYGEYDNEVLAIVGDLGYTAFGQQSGPIGENSNFLALPRFPMSGRYSDLETMKTKLDTLPLPVAAGSGVDPLLPLSETRPSLTLRFTRGDLRFDDLVCYGPSDTTELTRDEKLVFVARAKTPLPVGRSRYNCTMPTAEPGRFYWFSQLWIRRNPDGSWYSEP